ncbi:hypothetical protein O1R50_01700 [Glycomyces luteolus]|uniref:Uncharacterized protein n=1 Tax=Glycomyces luteolus TaxID=2670330 RepID=A0A9X3P7D7_9ACTN|nr:hypothetical protein [Glycomyces luteolus]MDA1358313.1 hypothetical protein [Glycomyces luteolus]
MLQQEQHRDKTTSAHTASIADRRAPDFGWRLADGTYEKVFAKLALVEFGRCV